MLSTELLAHYRHISQLPLTVVDVETTGSLAYRNRMTEIAVVRASLTNGIQETLTSLINPRCKIPAKIVEVTGITQEMVQAAPPAEVVLPDFLPALSEGVLTAHNLEFDYAFLKSEYGRLGYQFSRPPSQQLCTVQLARLMLPDLRSRSLPFLVQHFQFPVPHSHRAEADAIACWLLAQRLLQEIQNESDEVLLARFVRQWLPLKAVARMLGCSQKQAQKRLETVGVRGHSVGRNHQPIVMYQRGEVEQVYHALQQQ